MPKHNKATYEFRLNGKYKKTTIIDREDKHRVKNHKWHASHDQNRSTYYGQTKIKGTNIKLQNFIMKFIPNDIYTVDHINRNTLDNRKSNLRIVNKSIQQINQNIRSRNKTGVSGVYHDKKEKCWVASWVEPNKYKTKKGFYYQDCDEFKEAFILAFIYRKNKEREIEDYRIALCLDKTLYEDTFESLIEPYYYFNEFLLKNEDINIKRGLRKIDSRNKSGVIGVSHYKTKKAWAANWQENKIDRRKYFGYRYNDNESFKNAFINAFIYRKTKERDLIEYRIALGLENVPYTDTFDILIDPYIYFDAYMIKCNK